MSTFQERTLEEKKLNQQPTSSSSTSTSTSMSTSTNLCPENQDYWYYCSHSYTMGDNNVSNVSHDKDSKYCYNKDKKHLKKMDSLLCNSYEMLLEYLDPKMYPNHQLPIDLLQTCKGIMFLRMWKAGIFLGGISGTGIVMRHYNGSWSYPCAVSLGGIQLGLNLGVERVDDILILRDETSLNLIMEKGHFKLGVDASIAIGNFGRDSNTGVIMSGGESKNIYAYSFAKGAFIGLSLDGGVLSIADHVNEEYYGRKVSVKDIFFGHDMFVQDNEFLKLRNLLDSHIISSSHQSSNIINQPMKQNINNPVI